MDDFLFSQINLIDTLRELNPHRYKLACDLVKDSIIMEHSELVAEALGVKLSQKYNIKPGIAKVYISAAMWAMINNYEFDQIKCHTCNDAKYVQIAPNVRGLKKCPDCE